MSAETPTPTDEKKPKTLFIRCALVVIGLFLAVIILNVIYSWSFILDQRTFSFLSSYERHWSLWGGLKDPLAIRGKSYHLLIYIPLILRTALLLLAWWVFLAFCYICGKYKEVAENFAQLKWFGSFKFHLFPFGVSALVSFFILILEFIALVGGMIFGLLF
jgi:hypothetical protein